MEKGKGVMFWPYQLLAVVCIPMLAMTDKPMFAAILVIAQIRAFMLMDKNG